MSSFDDALANLSNAIASAEGYGKAGAIPTTSNNPGDLALGDIGYGTSGKGNITNYPDLASGEAALKNQVTKMLSGTSTVYNPDMSIDQVGDIYANGDTNWASNVAKALGVPSSTTLGSLTGGSTPTTATTTPTTSSSLFNSITNFLTGNQAASNQSGWLSRGVFVILGLLLIAGGIFTFKETQTVISTVGKHAAKAAELMI